MDAYRDTHVDKSQPSSSFGSATTLLLNVNSTKTKYAYVNTPDLSIIPAGATTTKTEVIVNPKETDASQTLSVYALSNCGWQSADLTWNSHITVAPPGALLGSATGTQAGVDKVIDIGNYVTANGAWCVVIKTSFSSTNKNRGIEADNDPNSQRPARFRITWTPAATTTTTLPPRATGRSQSRPAGRTEVATSPPPQRRLPSRSTRPLRLRSIT